MTTQTMGSTWNGRNCELLNGWAYKREQVVLQDCHGQLLRTDSGEE
jgi:hypothetical protein